MNWFVEFVKLTDTRIENVPEAYGLFHVIFVVLSLSVILAVCILTRKSSERVFRTVMLSVGALLILSEIYKQIYYYLAAGGEGYDWYIFPFQLCSVPMYLSFAIGFMKKSKVRDALCNYLASVGLLGGLMAFIEPSGIFNETYFLLIHSCLWHALLIFLGLYVLFTSNTRQRLRDYTGALATFGGVVLVATLLNIIFRNKKDFNMCYISPFYGTPLAVFNSFDDIFMEKLGQYSGRILTIVIYVASVALGGFIIYAAAFFIKKLITKLTTKKKEAAIAK